MDLFDMEDVVAPAPKPAESPLKDWRLKYQAGTIEKTDFIGFFKRESRRYYDFKYEIDKDATKPSLKCNFNETGAKEEIIDVLLAFILGDNPHLVLEKLRLEGNTAAVCGKVFKSGEPTYSCRECGMDPTCVLCVNCFKQSPHRYHKYKMSTSGGGGCCDCGDEEAWKQDPYCEEHLRGKEHPASSAIITDAIKERSEVAFNAILTFCVNYLEIETIASLACLDGGNEPDNLFCTVLYNDESHTFDQVIQTLVKIAKCRHKDANEIVASIDREGRAVVQYSSFHECCHLKEAIEKQSVTLNAVLSTSSRANQSLRVSVLHISAVACQQFALTLLSWFQEFLVRHCTFRQIFAKLVMDRKAPYSIRHLLEYDVKLWKTARTCWHRLLISGMLMEYDNKMILAQEFSRHYATIIQDFIRDDHEHSFSIVSLSVQLFTVPSIAHYLIAHEGIFYKLLHTFYHESIEKYIQNKTLHFTKNMASLGFLKRAAYILYDLRYILSFKPDVWTPELREGFLDGCKALMRLINVMQGMEDATRQTGQHMDYEPEWECAFNLHIKLASAISLVLEWSATDLDVLLKLYQQVMRYIVNNGFIVSLAKIEEKKVAGHVAKCLMYDVASRPVSIHLPLSRFFAGIYLHLGFYGLNFDTASTGAKRNPEEIMEPILCAQTMIAQVHSGLWRRNGYSLLHQLYFYRNVRCRSEMLDRDIVGMQIGASLIESNQFLIHILNKFALLDWIRDDGSENDDKLSAQETDDVLQRLISMTDEFLEFLIVIIGERYMPGISNITEEDRIKKEIIQLLCIKPFSHSELNRSLPDSNTGSNTVLEDVIKSVAIFKKPNKSEARGVYELKEELFDNYNMYFYHYTKEEKSKSEETQRERRKTKGELVCCPPPKLPKLENDFISIANLLQCDVMMAILTTVLDRALDLKSKYFQENHLQKALYLIGYGIQEEETGYYSFLSFCQHAQKAGIPAKLEQLSNSERVESHRDFILWTLRKFKEVQPNICGGTVAEGEAMQVDENCTNTGQSVSSSSTVATTLTAAEREKQEKEERSRLAKERREKIMAQMKTAQKIFMTSNADMFANTALAEKGSVPTSMSTSMEWQEGAAVVAAEQEEGATAYTSLACLGVERRLQQPEEQSFKCILCFEECTVSQDGPLLVYPGFLQKSKILPPLCKDDGYSVYTSSCGHVMHALCWQEYYNNEETKEQRRPQRSRSVLLSGTEFHCPYCRCLSNVVIPLSAPLSKYSQPNVIHAGDELFPIDLWVEVMRTFASELNKLRQSDSADVISHESLPALQTILKKSDVVGDVQQFEKIAQPISGQGMPASWTHHVQLYMDSVNRFAPTYDDLDIIRDDSKEDSRNGLHWMWQSCIYTIESLEVYLRVIRKPFKNELSIRHKSCMSGLIRACCLYASNLQRGDVKYCVSATSDLLDKVFKQKGESVLEWDCFSMMLSTIFMVPNMIFASQENKHVVANGNMMDFYTLQIFFLANMVKAALLFEDTATADSSMEVDEEEIEYLTQDIKDLPTKLLENVAKFYGKYNLAARRKFIETKNRKLQQSNEDNATEGDADGHTVVDGDVDVDDDDAQVVIECSLPTIGALFDHIKNEMFDFLRCCCLFFHFVTDVDFPDEFATYDGMTYESMCKYLGLNSKIETYFDNESPYAAILDNLASHADIVNYNFINNQKPNGHDFKIVPCKRNVPKLVDLPEDFSDLINSVSDFICPKSEREEMKTPTMCLICAKILCGQSYCCQPELDGRNVGACTFHAHSCGAEIGIFLRIRDCQFVYLGRNKGCFVLPPYLDEYGETDQGLRRGNPLRLCKERYNKIHLTWLGHMLHEEIARMNDTSSVTVMQWHHM